MSLLLGVLMVVVVTATVLAGEEPPSRVSVTLLRRFIVEGGDFLMGDRDLVRLFRVGVVGSDRAVGATVLLLLLGGLSLVRLSLLNFDRVGEVGRENCMCVCFSLGNFVSNLSKFARR